jgi:transposase
LVFSDESSINLAYTRLYGRAPKSERIKEGVKDVRFRRKSILSTLRLNGEKCSMIFAGTLNKERMSEWIFSQLAPSWNPEDIFVLDNSSVHKSKLARETFAACKIKILYLPRYSPDFSPIELMWANMKSKLKKEKPRSHVQLDDAIFRALNSVKLDCINHWFRHCGYSL